VPKRDEITGKWRRLHSEEFHDLYSSSNIRMIKLRMMRWAGHVARKGGRGEKKCIRGCGGGNLNERDILEDPYVDGRLTLKWILRKSVKVKVKQSLDRP